MKLTDRIIAQYKSKSVRKFKDRKAVEEYLEQEVFTLKEFKSNISETARSLKISYVVAYDVVTNYLIDILYEIDETIASPKKKKKISVYSYFSLTVGFMANISKKKLYINFNKR